VGAWGKDSLRGRLEILCHNFPKTTIFVQILYFFCPKKRRFFRAKKTVFAKKAREKTFFCHKLELLFVTTWASIQTP
jgi:hypothetical protein